MEQVSRALNIGPKDIVVLVGGGGKTTIISRLNQELLSLGFKIVITTTAMMYPPLNNHAGLVIIDKATDWQRDLIRVSNLSKYVYVGKGVSPEGKLTGLSTLEVQQMWELNCADIFLIEGDGARGRAFKAPRMHEPVIPGIATIVVPVIGIDCIGKPLSEEFFHVPGQVSALTGICLGASVTESDIARVLMHSGGYRKGLPPKARWVPFINKVESRADEIKALNLARMLIDGGTEQVLIGAAGHKDPVRFVCPDDLKEVF